MTRTPRLSVVVPAFQSQARIGAALEHLRRQSFAEFEVIVVNDGSSDQTAAIVHRAMETNPRIRLLEQDNRGIASARNLGVGAAHGELLAFLDDDDLWHAQKLELQLARLDAAPAAAVVSCFSALVDASGRLLGWRFGGETEGDVYREMLEWDMVSGGSVALVRRRVFEDAGGFDPSLNDRADWDLWIRIARSHPFTCVARTLVGYTRRPGSVSHHYEAMVGGGRDVLAKARREDPEIGDDRQRAYLARDLFAAGCLAFVDADLGAAWRYLARSLRADASVVLARPRRWGIVFMLALATVLPSALYRRALRAMSRGAFGLDPGQSFETLDAVLSDEGAQAPRDRPRGSAR